MLAYLQHPKKHTLAYHWLETLMDIDNKNLCKILFYKQKHAGCYTYRIRLSDRTVELGVFLNHKNQPTIISELYIFIYTFVISINCESKHGRYHARKCI